MRETHFRAIQLLPAALRHRRRIDQSAAPAPLSAQENPATVRIVSAVRRPIPTNSKDQSFFLKIAKDRADSKASLRFLAQPIALWNASANLGPRDIPSSV